jgi:hypothetical protein
MGDKARAAMEREKARLLEQAAAIDRDMAELDRIAAKYNLVVSAPGSKPTPKRARKPHKDEVQVAKGTLVSLVHRYRNDQRSPYRKLHYRTRLNYDSLIKRIIDDYGDQKLAELKAQQIQRFYEDWIEDGKIAMARSLITMLRMLLGFGATVLEDRECERLSVVLHKMRFAMAKPRSKERLTAEQADKIRAMAHKMGRPSLALAQALQFDLMLGQKDVIGEWVPQNEPGPPSDVIEGNLKWLRGLRWSEIDQNLMLRHPTGQRGKEIKANLRVAPMVMQELGLLAERPTTGPMIICEFSGAPWTSAEFRRWWRKLADACGIPKTVFNMDSRTRARTGANSPVVEAVQG